MTLLSIGEFARLSRLSAKALRRYDQLGLLKPARVDPDSGYRWYAAGQRHLPGRNPVVADCDYAIPYHRP
jgi:hypothetical protein